MHGKVFLRIVLVAAILLAIAVPLMRNASCAVGYDTYIDPDQKFKFEYPAGDSISHATLETGGATNYFVAVTDKPSASSFLALRWADRFKDCPAKDRAARTEVTMSEAVNSLKGKLIHRETVTRLYGPGERQEGTCATHSGATNFVLEDFVHGNDLYILQVTGNSEAIDDPKCKHFFESFSNEVDGSEPAK